MEFKKNLVLLACSILASLLCLELAVRCSGSYDTDGNFTFFGRVLRPFHLPLKAVRKNVEDYRTSDRTRIMYDPGLGWVPRPGIIDRTGLYASNSIGARTGVTAPVEYSMTHPAGSQRIVIVGDSYTFGEEVPFESTWGNQLEKELNNAGVRAEVINLGVGAYGLDQAFLRWLYLGSLLSPDIVILGLPMENVQRSVNLIKPIYQPNTGLPFSKPRFILSTDGLRMINTPTLPPQDLPAILKNPKTWDLAPYEHFLNSEGYRNRLYVRSKFLALMQELISPVEADSFFYDLKKEPAILALKILQSFKGEVEQRGARFLIVQIPNVYDLIILKLGMTPPWCDLLAKIGENITVVKTQDRFLGSTGWIGLPSLFMRGGHYTAKGNELIAEAIAERLIIDR